MLFRFPTLKYPTFAAQNSATRSTNRLQHRSVPAVTRTRSPDLWSEPSTTPSTPSCFAISGTDFAEFLYFIAEVREMTFIEPICERLPITASVTPSAKYSSIRVARKVRQRQNRDRFDRLSIRIASTVKIKTGRPDNDNEEYARGRPFDGDLRRDLRRRGHRRRSVKYRRLGRSEDPKMFWWEVRTKDAADPAGLVKQTHAVIEAVKQALVVVVSPALRATLHPLPICFPNRSGFLANSAIISSKRCQ